MKCDRMAFGYTWPFLIFIASLPPLPDEAPVIGNHGHFSASWFLLLSHAPGSAVWVPFSSSSAWLIPTCHSRLSLKIFSSRKYRIIGDLWVIMDDLCRIYWQGPGPQWLLGGGGWVGDTRTGKLGTQNPFWEVGRMQETRGVAVKTLIPWHMLHCSIKLHLKNMNSK